MDVPYSAPPTLAYCRTLLHSESVWIRTHDRPSRATFEPDESDTVRIVELDGTIVTILIAPKMLVGAGRFHIYKPICYRHCFLLLRDSYILL